MKKLLLIPVLVLMTASLGWSQPVPGNPVTTINPATITLEATTVDVNVTVADFSDVGNISLVLTYASGEINSPTITFVHPDIDAWGTFEANVAVSDTITLSAYNPDNEIPIYGVTLVDNDILFTISFTVNNLVDDTQISFFENTEGTSCEIGGIAPDYEPFIDTPQNDYYIPGVIELIDLDPGVIAAAQFICEGSDAAAFTSTAGASGEGDITYLWQSSITSETENFLDIEGAYSATYDPGTLTADTWYRRLATASLNDESWSESSNVLLVTVIIFDPEEISADQTICEGADVAAFIGETATGDGTFSYQWQSSTTGATEGFGDIEGAVSASYDCGSLSTDTWFRRETTASLGGSECTEYTNAVKVTVINFDPGTISNGETLCEGEDAGAITNATEAAGDGSIVYQWQVSTTGESTGFSNIEGATASSFDPGTIAVDTWFRRKASATVNGYTCDEYSNVAAVNVNTLDPGSIGNGQYIAEGANPAALTSVADAAADGTLSYQWQVSTTSGTEGFGNITDETASTYDPGVLTADAWYRRIASTLLNGITCTEYSNVIEVIVINFDPGSISDHQINCEGEDNLPFTSVADASGDGTLSHQWQSSTTSGTEGFSDIDGATLSTYDPGTPAVDTWFRRVTIATHGGVELSEYSNSVFITVINLSAGTIGNEQTICAGEDPAELTNVAGATGEGTVIYQWQSSVVGASEGFFDIEGATSATYNPGLVSADTWYRREASTTLYETECVKYTNAVKITAIQRKTISGTFYYYHASGNIALTGQNITVNLYLTSDVAHETLVATDVTDANGFYEFTNLCPGCDYDVVASSTGSVIGAINTTDAAQTNYWGAHNNTIERVKFYAGDVGTAGQCQDFTVNSTDAGRIQQKFVYGVPFDRSWTFWKAGTTISTNPACESYPIVNLPIGSNVVQNMYALATGDFNRSFNPVMTKAAVSTIEMRYAGNRMINGEQEFDLPVRMVNASTVGAMSLILNIPVDLIGVKDVVMNGASGTLDWALVGNELRIGWNSSTPLYLSDNAELVTLRLKTTAEFTAGTPVMITLANDPLNEIADETYDVIGDAIIALETINGNALGLSEPVDNSGLFFSNYPNPFGNSTKFSYTLPADGQVTISISNFTGSHLMTLASEYQSSGNHEITMDLPDMPTGIYIATITFRTANDVIMKTHKIIKK